MTLEQRTLARDLWFPEGPVALSDGSILLVEMRRQTLTRVAPSGSSEVIGRLGGGPNGAALGPDGKVFVCNNGGFAWSTVGGRYRVAGIAPDYRGGSIQTVDLGSGEIRTLYTHCGDIPLRGPNDLVFDRDGGFYFTDLGKRRKDDLDIGAIYYAKADGTHIERIVFPFDRPNGIGLSPDGSQLYVNETYGGRVWQFELAGPGSIIHAHGHYSDEKGRVLAGLAGYQFFDGMAIEANGNLCIATMVTGAISVITPAGQLLAHVPVGDPHITNLCFGGPDYRTLYVTLGGRGELIALAWPRAGLKP